MQTYRETFLTLKREKKEEDEESEQHYYKEQYFGSFPQSSKVPAGVQAENVEAIFDNGILEIKFLKTEESKKREIQINVK